MGLLGVSRTMAASPDLMNLRLIFSRALFLLHWAQEANSYPEEVSPHPHQEEGSREDQPQVHRHQLQVRPRKVPDPPGQGCLHGPPQEGPQGVGRPSPYKMGLSFKISGG